MNHIGKSFGKYVSLNIIGMLGLSCYILADTFFVAKALGTSGLAALNLSISVFSIVHGIGLMLGIGGATRFNISKNSGDSSRSNTAFCHALIGGAFFSILFLLIGLFLPAPLSGLLGADSFTLPFTKIYVSTILKFSPCFILNNILLAFIRNDDNPRLSMTAMLVSSLSNILLDYLFMFPLSMGIFGAALATSLSPVISMCILSVHFFCKKNTFSIQKCKIALSSLLDIAALGFSALITELASAIVLITFNLIILRIGGNTNVAAYGIVANIALIITAIFVGVAQGIQPLASNFFGTRRCRELRSLLTYSLILTVILSLAAYGLLAFFASPIAAAFNSEGDPALASIAVRGMKLYFIGFLFAGINIIGAAFLSALSNYKSALRISLMRGCVFIIPLALLFGFLFQMTGIWLSFVVTEFIVCILTVHSLRCFFRKA